MKQILTLIFTVCYLFAQSQVTNSTATRFTKGLLTPNGSTAPLIGAGSQWYNTTQNKMSYYDSSCSCWRYYLSDFSVNGVNSNQISVGRSNGVLTLSLPQDIGLTSVVRFKSIGVNDNTGTTRDVTWSTAGVLRWIARVDSDTESGGNSGSTWRLLRRTDAGGVLSSVISIDRATGFTTFNGGVSVSNTPTNPNDVVRKTELDLKAPLASPVLTGTPVAPTATAGTNTTQIATTAFVQSALSSVASGTPTISEGLATVVGTGATISIVGNNIDGVITLVTGTGISAGGTVFTVTFGGGLSYPVTCVPIIQNNTTAGTINTLLGIQSQNASSWSAVTGVMTGPGISDSQTYKWNYHAGGY